MAVMNGGVTDTDDVNDVLILYATEGGTAHESADRIARHVRRVNFKARIYSMEEYDTAELINESLVVFVVSTTGTGVQPRMMTPLWNMLLRADLPEDLFEDMLFGLFALGDTAYDRFCWPGKKLARRLQSLGAQELLPRGEGDEQHRVGIDGALDPWMDNLNAALESLQPPQTNGRASSSANAVPPPRARVTPDPSSSALREEWRWPLEDIPQYHRATVSTNERITAAEWNQDVRHMEYDFDEDISYAPGDSAVIHPEVPQAAVDDFLATVGWRKVADKPFRVTRVLTDQTFPEHLPPVVTLRLLFTRYLDFTCVPRKTFFQFISYFTSDEREKEKLDDFLTEEGADDLYQYCFYVRRSIKEILDDFHSVKIPLEYVFDVFPPLRPREFSIASSVKKHPRKMQLCVAIINYKTKLKAPRKGICTCYLAGLNKGDTLYIGIRKGFIPKLDVTKPIIGVGPGTGLAPVRAIVQERLLEQPSTSTTFYFGCRSATKDQHYASEMKNYSLDSSRQFTYRVACSRDGPEGVKRTYVQDLILEDAKRICHLLLKEGATVVISGASNKMPAGVREALRDCIVMSSDWDEDKAKVFVDKLEREGRLVEDCWS